MKRAPHGALGSLPSPCGRRGGDEGPHPHSLSRKREREASRSALARGLVHSGRGEVGESLYSGRNEGEGERAGVRAKQRKNGPHPVLLPRGRRDPWLDGVRTIYRSPQ